MHFLSITASGTTSSLRPPGAWRGRWMSARHVILDVDLRRFGGSALTDVLEVPKDRPAQAMSDGIPVTYVPARNTVLLSLALAYAETVAAADIFVGVNAVDYSGYPDCRPEFIAAFQQLANLATKAGVEGELKFVDPHAADPDDQGPDHSPRSRIGSGLLADPLLLRPGRERSQLRPLRRLPTAPQRFCRGRTLRPAAVSRVTENIP